LIGGLFGLGGGSAALPAVGVGALYDRGGYTGVGGKMQPAGIVHRGEYVFDQDAVNRIGVGNLEAIRRAGGYARGGPAGVSIPHMASPRGRDAISFNMPISISADGADSGQLARLVGEVQTLRATIPGIVVKTVKDAQSRRALPV
jgi:lambda family phage tail tape measure protein